MLTFPKWRWFPRGNRVAQDEDVKRALEALDDLGSQWFGMRPVVVLDDEFWDLRAGQLTMAAILYVGDAGRSR